jgi:hypothetical protein
MVDVAKLQMKLQDESFAAVVAIELMATKLLAGSADVSLTELFTSATNEQANKVVIAWRDLLPKLITKYHDGYQAEGLQDKDIAMKRLFYPAWWLNATGYFNSKINTGPGVIMFSPGPHRGIEIYTYIFLALKYTYVYVHNKYIFIFTSIYTGSYGYTWVSLLSTAIISSAFSLLIGYYISRRYSNKAPLNIAHKFSMNPIAMGRRMDYVAIDI